MPESDRGAPPPDRREQGRRRYLRRAARVAAVLGVGFFAVLLLAAIGGRIYLNESRTRGLVERTLNDILAGTFRIGGFAWDRFPDEVTLTDLEVLTPEGASVGTLKRVSAGIDLESLLTRRVAITHLELEAGRVDMAPGPGGESFAFAAAVSPPPSDTPEPESDAPAWIIELEGIDVAGLDLKVVLDGMTVEVLGLSMEDGGLLLDLPVVDSGTENLTATTVKLEWPDRAVVLDDVQLKGTRYQRNDDGPPRLTVGRLSGQGPGLDVQGSGWLGAKLPMDANLNLEVEADLTDEALWALVPESVKEHLKPKGAAQARIQLTGLLEAPDVDVALDAQGLVARDVVLEKIHADASWQGPTVTAKNVSVTALGTTLTGEAKVGLAAGTWSATLRAKQFPARRIGASWVDASYLPRRVDGTLTVESQTLTSLDLVADVDVELTGLPAVAPAGLPEVLKIKSRAKVGETRTRLTSFEVTGEALSLTATGTVPHSEAGRLDLKLDAKHARPDPILAGYDAPLSATGVHLAGSVTGTFTKPEARGRLSVNTLRVEGLPTLALDAPFSFSGETLHLEDLAAHLAGGRVEVSGSVRILSRGELADPITVDLATSASGLSLSPFTEGKVTGRVQAAARVTGPVTGLSGTGSVRAADLEVSKVRFSEASGTVTLDPTEVSLNGIRLTPASGEGGLEVSGRYLFEDGGLDLRVLGGGLPLALADAFLEDPLPVKGLANADLTVTGTAEAPKVEGQVSVTDLLVLEDEPLGTLNTDLSWTGNDLHANGELDTPAGTIALDLGYGLESGRVDGTLRARDLAIAELPGLPDPEAPKDPPVVDGKLAFDLTLGGPFPVPGLTGTMRIQGLSYAGDTMDDGQLVARLWPRAEDQGFFATLNGLGFGDIEVEVTPGPPIAVDVKGDFRRLSVPRLVRSLESYDLGLLVTGTLEAGYTVGAPNPYRLEVTLPEINVDIAGQKLSAEKPAAVSWSGGDIRVRDLALQGKGGRMQVDGAVGETISLRVLGRVEMALLAPFITSVSHMRGRMDMDLTARGTASAPELLGTAHIADPVSLRPRTMVREVRIVRGDLVFEPGRVKLVDLSGQIESGAFQANGEVALKGYDVGGWRLDLDGQNVPLRTSQMGVELNLDLSARGQGLRSTVSGKVDIVDGRYLQQFELYKFSFKPTTTELDEPLGEKYPWLEEISLDLHASSSGGLNVEADAGPFSMKLTLDSNIHIGGTAADMVLEGRVESTRGKIIFPEADLEVTRAVIDFEPTAADGIRPLVDLEARGDVTADGTDGNTYEVTMALQGDPSDEIPLELTSIPNLTELDILSLLTTGRVALELTDTSGGSNLSKGDAAIAFAGSQLAEPLTRFVTAQLEKILNLEVDLDTQVSSEGVGVTAGKRFNSRFLIEGGYQKNFTGASISELRAEYLLSDSISLEFSNKGVNADTGTSSTTEEAGRKFKLKLRLYGD